MENVFIYFDQFVVLSPEARNLVLSTVDLIEIKKNTKILSVDSLNKYMYIIKKGLVRGYKSKAGIEITLSLWMENETFGDVTTYITGNPVRKSYEAIEDLEVYRLNIAKFRALFQTNLEICNLGRVIIEQFILKTELIKDNLRANSAEQKMEFFLTNRPGLIDRVKLKHIASYLDIAPETLSRIKHKLVLH
jgi:CRP-like cAMP-binding protein